MPPPQHRLGYKSLPVSKDIKIAVLVVDNNISTSDNLIPYLTKLGYSATSVDTGQKALERIKQNTPHITLLDLKLPDISGIELLKSIKTASPHTIIILISGCATIDAAAESIRHGAYDFLTKPFNFEEVEITLRRAMDIKSRNDELLRLKKRNILIAFTLPIWALLGYLFVSLF